MADLASGVNSGSQTVSPAPNINPSSPCPKMAVAEPKIVRKLLPVAAFLITFATVMTMLLVYMDTNAMRHHQFQINMTQDYDLMGVTQDNDMLITYIREVHIRPAIDLSSSASVTSIHSKSPHDVMHQRQAANYFEPTEKEQLVAKLSNNKQHGVFLEAGAYRHGRLSDTEWLERNLSWSGLLVQTYPRDFFDLLKRGRSNSKAIHACLSTQPHPKEITIPQDGHDGVKINSIHVNSVFSDDSDWFTTRIKCFPLYSLMLAMNTTYLDFLSIETDCNEFEILQTLPFEQIKVEIMSVHFQKSQCVPPQPTVNNLKRYLASYNYKLVQRFGDDYLFMLNHVKI